MITHNAAIQTVKLKLSQRQDQRDDLQWVTAATYVAINATSELIERKVLADRLISSKSHDNVSVSFTLI
jgi:hypothetical protein